MIKPFPIPARDGLTLNHSPQDRLTLNLFPQFGLTLNHLLPATVLHLLATIPPHRH
jgi:hypothetical protein